MRDILFLAHRLPFPPDRGDKIRSYHVLTHLAQRARVHLVTFADDPRDRVVPPEIAALTASCTIVWRGKPRLQALSEALVSRQPMSLTAFADAKVRAAAAQVLARHDIGAIYVFSGQMAQYLPASNGARVIMDFVDMDSAKFADYARGIGPIGWLMRREARLLRRHEAAVAARANASLFVSEAEAALFVQATGAERVLAVENGIDTVRYDPAAAFPAVERTGPLIVFTGQMDYRPNIEGVTAFAREVLPLVRTEYPDARFAIVGRAPTAAVQALATLPGVEVTGEVPDVRGWLAAADVVVAPLSIARGVQNKVLEAMAMARPVVASPAAAQGIDHAGTIRVAATGPAMAAAVAAILSDTPVGQALGEAARVQVIARYGWAARLAPLDALLPGVTPVQAAA